MATRTVQNLQSFEAAFGGLSSRVSVSVELMILLLLEVLDRGASLIVSAMD